MAALTQSEIAQQIIAQLRILDPSVSAEIGTPERKIIDSVAQALADAQIDLNVLSGQLSLDSKFGSNLDKFLALFGFSRQQATRAQGFVTFSRLSISDNDIPIPGGTQIQTDGNNGSIVIFRTVIDVTLPAGDLSVAAPIEALVAGVSGNVAAHTITGFAGSPVFGITGVTNESPTQGGVDQETDDSFKIRFKNTVFRNLAGTEDQYLALAAALAFTTKANVVGPVSKYQEYLQIPPVDDATAYPDGSYPAGNGNAGEYTTALSAIPLSKNTYKALPVFVANQLGAGATFYRQDVDYNVNTTPTTKNRGDAFRLAQDGEDVNPVTDTLIPNSSFPQTYVSTVYRPNITFLNVYTGVDETVTAPRPLDTVLVQHYYLSNASRNDFVHNITNAVDVFVDGDNSVNATTVLAKPSGANTFVNNVNSLYYIENFRRIGEPEHRPILGNLLTPLFSQPVTGLPDQIQIGTATYLNGIHYWGVEEVDNLGGTVRARNGIEWSIDVKGKLLSDPDNGPYTGPTIIGNSAASIEISNYTYDQNVVNLQAALDGSKQVTTDVLGHRAKKRFFKLQLVVIYTSGFSPAAVNQDIHDAVGDFFARQYFGAIIQLSDLLQHIHEVPGVDSVRWTRDDIRGSSHTTRVIECDINGQPLTDVLVGRKITGVTSSVSEVQLVYATRGWLTPTNGGSFKLKYNTTWTSAIPYLASAATVNSALTTAGALLNSVTGTGTPQDPYIVTFDVSIGPQTLLLSDSSGLTNGTANFNADFFLQDNELPNLPTGTVTGDTLPGLVISSRAQNTFNRT